MKMLAPAILVAFLAVGSSAQEAPSPYRGQEGREIKALSVEEIDSLQAGDGMGLAKAAELNIIPDRGTFSSSPKHSSCRKSNGPKPRKPSTDITTRLSITTRKSTTERDTS